VTQNAIDKGKDYCVLTPTQLMKIDPGLDTSATGNQAKVRALFEA